MPARVLIDANVFVSAFINPKGFPTKVLDAWLKGKFSIVVSVPLLEEIAEVLKSPRIKVKYGFSDNEIAKFLQLIAERSEWVTPAGKLKICRHPNDDLILESAIVGKAKYLISRDGDIKGDKSVIAKMRSKGVIIISVRSFLERLEDGV